MKREVIFIRLVLCFITSAQIVLGQTPVQLRGLVADEFGAIIRKASITLEDGKGHTSVAQTDGTVVAVGIPRLTLAHPHQPAMEGVMNKLILTPTGILVAL